MEKEFWQTQYLNLKEEYEELLQKVEEQQQKIEWLENRKEEILLESGERWTKLIKIKQILSED